MRLDWILVRICLNFNFLASKWHLIASSTLNLLFLESDDFLQGPFTGKCNGQKNEIGLDSSQNLSKFSIPSLKMALNGL